MAAANHWPFEVDASTDRSRTKFNLQFGAKTRSYCVAATQQDYFRFFAEVARDFGARTPHAFREPEAPGNGPSWRPLITDSLNTRTLCGYGDPAVLRIEDGWLLTATSNDAPDAFPLLFSPDLKHWDHRGFIFPADNTPAWAVSGPGEADFWAPEIAKIGDAYWAAFTARQPSRALAIGLARASGPFGPWVDNGEPLITGGRQLTPGGAASGGVIDPHIFVDDDGSPFLFWKNDTNGLWPRPLAGLLRDRPEMIPSLFDREEDRRTAALAAAIVPWANSRRSMERFFLMQPLIEAVLANWERVRPALVECGKADEIVEAMRTTIHASRMAVDGRSLIGEERIGLFNDQDWEGHLVEGPFVTRQQGRYWMFYAGNDFSSPAYGIGVAVADHPFGPYRKRAEPLLKSNREWWAPGHASVATGVDGRPQLFFHAFFPQNCGYNAFRAVLTVGLEFSGDEVRLRQV